MTAKTKRLGGDLYGRNTKKCAEKQLKIRTGNWFLPGLMIVPPLLGAQPSTAFILEYRIRNGRPDCWMKQNRKEKFCWKTSKIRPDTF